MAEMRRPLVQAMRVAAYLAAFTLSWAAPISAEAVQPSADATPAGMRARYDAARVDWQPMPEDLANLVIVANDRHFRTRPLIRSAMVAHFARINAPREKGLLGHARTITTAGAISGALSHDEFLDWYLHSVYLGQGCYGVDEAALAYFGKPVDRLALHEAAYLAAAIAAPARAPDQPDWALGRRNFALQKLAEAGLASEAEVQDARAMPLALLEPPGVCAPAVP